jgi:hypothetical protein
MDAWIALCIASVPTLCLICALYLMCKCVLFGRPVSVRRASENEAAPPQEKTFRSHTVSLSEPPGQIAVARSGPSGPSAADATHWIVVVQPAETAAA